MKANQIQSVVTTFDHIANKYPDRTAVAFLHDGKWEKQSYAQLLRRAQAVALCLVNAGIASGDAIVLPAARNRDVCAEMLGILWIGAHYVFIDPAYPKDRQGFICNEVKAEYGINSTSQNCLLDLPVDWLKVDYDAAISSADLNKLSSPAENSELPAYVIFTSGSTGTPKGVVIPHRGISRLVCNTNYVSFSADEVFLQLSSLSFDASTFEVWGALLNGGTCVLHPENGPITPIAIQDSIRANGVSTVWLTASHYNELISEYPEVLQGVKQLLVGGEELSVQHIRAGLENLPSTRFFNGYGPTENTTFTTVFPLPEKLPESMKRIPIGSPIAGTECGVYSAGLELLPKGEVGELIAFGDGLALDYLNDSKLYAERFVDVTSEGGEVRHGYRTGDLVVELDGGVYDFIGRNDAQVKIDGHRIEPGEIEFYLNGLDQVAEARVIVVTGPKNQKRIAAYIVGKSAIELTVLRAELENHFPRYMVPHFIKILDKLPKNSSGKLDRSKLPDPFSSTMPEAMGHPRVSACWENILGRSIPKHENFFDAGGTSLEAIALAKELESEFDRTISATFVFEFSTIAAQAKQMGDTSSSQQPVQDSIRGDLTEQDIAVVGIACRFPGAADVSEYWSNLIAGKETISFFAAEELDQLVDPTESSRENYVRAKGIIADCDKFDAEFFGISPLEAKLMDPQQRIMLQLCWHAFEDAAISPGDEHSRTGVFIGANWPRYYQQYILPNKDLLKQSGAFNAALANEADFLCTRISYKLNLKGPSTNIHTACSTSLVAIAQAAASINSGQCEQALAGGISVSTPVKSGYLYQEGSMLSHDGHCRPFDEQASGTTFNDGAGVVLLKRRDLAERDGDPIYAIIKGAAVNNDGEEKASFSAPSIGGQVAVYRDALAKSGVEPSSVGFIETHGTATPLGDPIEVESLSRVYTAAGEKQAKCAIGSVKSNIGHTVHAAGIAGFIKAVLAVKNNAIPPTLFFEKANPRINWKDTSFYVNSEVVQWEPSPVRRAAVSALGVGGTNAHVIIEEAHSEPHPEPSDDSRRNFRIPFSAKSEESLRNKLEVIGNYLRTCPENSELADIAYTCCFGRKHFDYRYTVVANSISELTAKLEPCKNLHSMPASGLTSSISGFMFSGQGSQLVNMGRWFYENDDHYRELFDLGSEIVLSKSGIDVRQYLFDTSEDGELEYQISDTIVAQPSLFLLEYCIAQNLLSQGCKPDFMLGHSVGEFVAATLSGVFSFEDAISLVASRGALMQSMPGGSMLVVKKDIEAVEMYLGNEVWLAANNAPSICVFSGTVSGIEQAQSKLNKNNIENSLLRVSHAFHSGMMDPIVDEFRSLVEEIELHAPKIPIISTMTGQILSSEEATSSQYWAAHLRQPVEFSKAIQTAKSEYQGGAISFLEVGPGTTLSTLVSMQDNLDDCSIVSSLPNSGVDAQAAEDISSALNSLWAGGFELDWSLQFAGISPRRIRLPGYAFKADRHWLDAPVQQEADGSSSILSQLLNQPALADSPAPTTGVQASPQQHFESTRNQILSLLEDVTGFDLSDVSADSEFSEIGLDSLTMTQAAMAIERTFEAGISFRNLMEDYTTLTALTQFIAEQTPPQNVKEATEQPTGTANQLTNLTQLGSISEELRRSGASANLESLIKAQIQIAQLQLQALQSRSVAEASTKPTGTTRRVPESSGKSKPSHKPGTRINKQKIGVALSVAQQNWINEILDAYQKKFAKSKANAQKHRKYLADPRTVSGFNPEWKEIVFPIVTERSQGSRLWDVDGNELIDISNGFGPIFFGHSPKFITDAVKNQLDTGIETGPQSPLAGEVAELFCELTGNERCTFASTGSEAVAGAIRLARTVTGRTKIVMFDHSYHGIFDEVVNRPGRDYQALPGAPGIPMESTENVLVLPWADEESIDIIRELGKDLAAVLVEPVQSRHPQFHSGEYLRKLRQVTQESDTALIFDEVVTGFRVAAGGIQEYFEIEADLATYGKVVGGGHPIGIIGGKAKYMDALDGGQWQFGDDSVPECGVTFFAGTFVRHPVALAAAKAVLLEIKNRGDKLYTTLETKTENMATEAKRFIAAMKSDVKFEEFASLFYVSVPDSAHWGHLLFVLMTLNGVNIQSYRPNFLTTEHSAEDIAEVLSRFKNAVAELIVHGLLEGDAVAAGQFLRGNSQSIPSGARLGKNAAGEPAYFIEDSKVKGKFIEVGKP